MGAVVSSAVVVDGVIRWKVEVARRFSCEVGVTEHCFEGAYREKMRRFFRGRLTLWRARPLYFANVFDTGDLVSFAGVVIAMITFSGKFCS